MHQSLAEGVTEAMMSSEGFRVSVRNGFEALHPRRAVDGGVAMAADLSPGNIGGMLMAAVILLALGLAGVMAWRGGVPAAIPLVSRTASVESSTESSAGSDSAAIEPDSADATETTAEPEPEPKSDPEMIVEILEDHEGRMKQANIVNETGWSKSKVSMLLSDMEDDGEISKLRVGRENIISLSGNEPEAAGSPFEDE